MIDRELTYYRVLHTREGYYSDAEERFDTRTNLAESDEVDLEFDTLEGIGHWLFLGTEIQSLRIPGDAKVERNSPLGQGGCYAFSSNRLRILETLSIAEWLRRLGTRYDGSLHVKDIVLVPGFLFPECRMLTLAELALDSPDCFRDGTDSISLRDVRLAPGTKLPSRTRELSLNGIDLDSLEFPESLSSLQVENCIAAADLDFTRMDLRDLQIEQCDFLRLRLPATLNQVRVLRQSSTDFLEFAEPPSGIRFTFAHSTVSANLRSLLSAAGADVSEFP